MAGVPAIGTAGETYNDAKDWAVLGPETPQFWEDALEDVIANLDTYQERAEARVAEAREFFIADHNLDKFEAVYRRIISDFQDDKTTLPNCVFLDGTIPPNPVPIQKPAEFPDLNRKLLEQEQVQNLGFTGAWLKMLPRVSGVNTALALQYNLVQSLNNEAFQEAVKDE